MKKVLVTGASGAIGQKVLKYLLSEGKYEITALDLRSKKSQKILRKYRRRINIVFADINDTILIEALIKDHDYIIHLASVMPPLADIKKNLSHAIEYKGTENIIKAINYYNPNCCLIYASSTTIYGPLKEASTKSPLKVEELDYYAQTKIDCEKLIKSKLKNYVIVRIPLLLTNPKTHAFMYNVKNKELIDTISDNDAAFMLTKTLDNLATMSKKTYNISGGDATRCYYKDLLIQVLSIYGLSLKYLVNLFFVDKNFYTQKLTDTSSLNDILEYRSDSLSSYYMHLKRTSKKRGFPRLLAKPIIWILRRKK